MIEFKNVSKIYDNGTVALKDVNLRINRGEFVFIVGASGAGKSTFLKTIMREEVPTSGTIMINNYDLTKMTNKEIPYFRRTMGIVFQDFRLIPKMTVYDNVAFAMRVIGANEKDIRKRVPYVLTLVGLQDKARSLPNEISGGEQQRVALARALVNNANIIIADEPTGNIDPEMSYEIVDLLNHINENGTTVIMVTHEHELVKQFNHRIVVIDNGVVVSDMANGGVLQYHEDSGYQSMPTLTSMRTVTLNDTQSSGEVQQISIPLNEEPESGSGKRDSKPSGSSKKTGERKTEKTKAPKSKGKSTGKSGARKANTGSSSQKAAPTPAAAKPSDEMTFTSFDENGTGNEKFRTITFESAAVSSKKDSKKDSAEKTKHTEEKDNG